MPTTPGSWARKTTAVYAFVHEGLAAIQRDDLSLDDWVGTGLKCGEVNLRAMELLDAANTGAYGHPVPTQVPLGAQEGQGHPGLRPRPEGPGRAAQADRGQGHQRLHPRRDAARPRLPGAEEISPFLRPLRHGLAEPEQGVRRLPRRHPDDHQLHPEAAKNVYKDNIFTTGLVGWPGVTHIADRDFAPVIEKALAMPGFHRGYGRAAGHGRASPATPCWAWPTRSSRRSSPAPSGISSWWPAATAPSRAATTTPSSSRRSPRTAWS